VQTKTKNTSARLSRLSESYLTLLSVEDALVLTTPVRHFQRLAFRAERRAYKRYAIVLNEPRVVLPSETSACKLVA
jgi:hypothetical protein